jgi:transcriptional regulator with PAS, ATPase and Fis domain
MVKNRILYSWIGHNDLIGMAGDAQPDQQTRVLSALHIDRKVGKQDGPIKSLLKQEKFTTIHLLSNYPKWLSGMFLEWLGYDATVHTVKLDDPTDYEQILTATDSVLGNTIRDANSEYSFFLTPGTPSMAATWILVGKSRFDATFWQSHQGKSTRSVIPFDVVAGFATELAAVPDVSLQHLATRPPKEIEGFEKISGSSKALRLAAGRAAKAAHRDVSVLILGGPGTGKEMFAEAIHEASRRKGKPFIKINCAAIPAALLESQLFGYVAGAFTGAKTAQPGAFERADGGTLFLDEVGECTPEMQAALLRVLQPPHEKGPCHREFSPVGDIGKTIKVDVRIISATNRDLMQEVDEAKFREDLFYRLSVIKVKLPSLCSRKSDIPELVETLLAGINRDFRSQEPHYKDKSISETAKRFVREYDWPGNVRQLHNTLVEAAIMSESNVIEIGDIKSAIADVPGKRTGHFDYELGDGFCLQTLLEDIQRRYLERAMDESLGVKTKAAELLGMSSYQTLDAQLKRLRVPLSKPK